jgi:hypothetical protein
MSRRLFVSTFLLSTAAVSGHVAIAQESPTCLDTLKTQKAITLFQVMECIQSIETQKSKSSDTTPVGTVVASLLEPQFFSLQVGDEPVADFSKKKWILADGGSVGGSQFAKLTGKQSVPDLRNMFLRGINPSGSRKPGDAENYATALPTTGTFSGTTALEGIHSHGGGAGASGVGDRFNAGGKDYVVIGLGITSPAGEHSHTFQVTGGGDQETRPVNVAVYYYVRIN